MPRRFPRIAMAILASTVLLITALLNVSIPAAANSIGSSQQTADKFEPTSGLAAKVDSSRLDASFESSVLKLINAERTKRGLKKLALNTRLTKAAEAHSVDMAKKNYFSHTGSNGSSMSDRFTAVGYKYSAAGETIYAGGGTYNTPAQCVKAWMNSTGHRNILLNPTYTQIGIGYYYYAKSTYGGYYTADLGKPQK